jgi:hypothetical protein
VPAKDTNLRPRLTAAATVLREMSEVDLEDTAKLREIKQADLADLAEAIDSILVPNGWGRLRRSEPSASDSLHRNMGIYMPREWRTQIQERAQKEHDKQWREQVQEPGAKKRSIKDDINEGFELYLAGKFDPVAPERRPRGSADDMVNLNARPKDDLRKAIEQQGDHAPALVAGAYLMSKYKVGPYAPKKAAKK